MRRTALLLLSGACLLSCGDQESTTSGWTQRSDAPEEAQVARAVKARDDLTGQLLARLGAAMKEGGPAAGVDVCHSAAPEIAAAVSKTSGVQIGRSSFRLRNPSNTAPDWAQPSIEEKVSEPRFFDGPDGQLGALYPIKLQERCVTCHGQEEQIPAPVKQTLAKHYPDDRATGFAPGDLRGYFWVEVPR